MTDASDIQQQLGDVLRLGAIHAVDHAAATCRATIGALVTGDLPWLVFRAGGTRYWSPPSVGEQCLILAPEGDTENGVILVGLYSDAHPAPDNRADLDLVEYADGARIAYDAVAHALSAILPAGATATLTVPGGITIDGDVTINGTVTASTDVIGGGISLKSHTHGGVQSGGAQTGAPA